MVSQAVDNEMLVPGWYWGILAGAVAAGLAATASFVLGATQIGALLALAAVVAGTVFFVLAQKTLFASSPFAQSSVFSGQAPYRTWDCTPSAEFANALATMLQELLQATQGQQCAVSVQTAQRYAGEAVAGHKKGNFASAIRNYAQAINSLMREIKKEET
jgi:hypothetical protein